MKRIAIVSRALLMNGATKALVEMLKRIDRKNTKLIYGYLILIICLSHG